MCLFYLKIILKWRELNKRSSSSIWKKKCFVYAVAFFLFIMEMFMNVALRNISLLYVFNADWFIRLFIYITIASY